MSGKYAILIDAGFLKRKLGSQERPLSANRVVQFTNTLRERPELASAKLHRIYYYDAEPLQVKKPKPLTGGPESWTRFDFASTSTFESNIQLLNSLKKENYFAIRLGEVHFRGWLVKPQKLNPKRTATEISVTATDLIPNVQQKGVDMRIGLDIASLSLKNHVDIIALVTGDSDFVPALKFARREGKQVFVYTLGHSVLPDIITHSDICITATAECL
jgi:uncharacterized LabA/DUF88 family protein